MSCMTLSYYTVTTVYRVHNRNHTVSLCKQYTEYPFQLHVNTTQKVKLLIVKIDNSVLLGCFHICTICSNGNASETKANESFDNGVFFDIEAKRTPSIVSKLFSKRSEHIRQNENYFRSEANTFDSKTTVFKAKANMSDSKKIIFEAKRTHHIERKLFLKRSEHIRQTVNYFQRKRTCPSVSKVFLKQSEHIRQKQNYF